MTDDTRKLRREIAKELRTLAKNLRADYRGHSSDYARGVRDTIKVFADAADAIRDNRLNDINVHGASQ